MKLFESIRNRFRKTEAEPEQEECDEKNCVCEYSDLKQQLEDSQNEIKVLKAQQTDLEELLRAVVQHNNDFLWGRLQNAEKKVEETVKKKTDEKKTKQTTLDVKKQNRPASYVCGESKETTGIVSYGAALKMYYYTCIVANGDVIRKESVSKEKIMKQYSLVLAEGGPQEFGTKKELVKFLEDKGCTIHHSRMKSRLPTGLNSGANGKRYHIQYKNMYWGTYTNLDTALRAYDYLDFRGWNKSPFSFDDFLKQTGRKSGQRSNPDEFYTHYLLPHLNVDISYRTAWSPKGGLSIENIREKWLKGGVKQ